MSLFETFISGGFVMYPLLLCSLATWVVIIERSLRYRRVGKELREFHLEAQNLLLRNQTDALQALCVRHAELPTANLLKVALDRRGAEDDRVKETWVQAVERRRQLVNQELRKFLWILGTIASASPFIGLFGTVVGILGSFRSIADTGQGGFTVVASGISEALIATAAGIIVAVIAVIAFNAFQTRWGTLVVTIRLQIEELLEILALDTPATSKGKP